MHLLMIAPEQIPVPSFKGGSVEICMYAIARRWARHHQVTLVSRKHRSYPRKTVLGNLTIVRLPSGGQDKYIAAVAAYVKGKKFDWIQIDNRPRFVSKIRSVFPHTPISVYLHSLTFVSARHSTAVHLAKADLIVANSNSLEQELKARFPSIQTKIKQVYLGVDLQQFKPPSAKRRTALRKKYGLQGSFVFGYAGRVIPRKGIHVLMRAIKIVRKSVPEVQLTITGGGKRGYIANLKNLAHRLHIPAKFIGSKSHANMQQSYWLADCLVCPSQKHEAFGLVNIEAMATGIPVIASGIGGIKEIISHGNNGWMVADYHNPADFAVPMLKLAKNRKLTQTMGNNARQDMIRRFSWKQTANSLIQLYNKNS